MKGISVIICTYNGAERLSKTIEYIANQSVSREINWEVILADNSSIDNSGEIGRLEWEKFHSEDRIPFRVIYEDKPGKLFALQHAISEANYEYLIICDDDNWLGQGYLERAYSILDSMPEVGAAGGRGFAVTDAESLPEWFKDYQYAYAVGPQAEETGVLRPKSVLWGAGLATRKALYNEMYKKYPSFLTECTENNILSAEDTEYCLRLLLKGYKLYYDSQLVYTHFIPSFKTTIPFREKLLKGFKDSSVILGKYYPAMRVNVKAKGKPITWMSLLLISPFNYVFSFSGRRAEKAKNTLYHLLPFGIKTDRISGLIKKFVKER